MTTELRFGNDKKYCVSEKLRDARADVASNLHTLESPAAAVSQALVTPLEFPPLTKALVPGDCIALAVGPDVPQVAEVVGGVIQSLLNAGTLPRRISIVVPAETKTSDFDALSADQSSGQTTEIEVVVHDPTDQNQLSFLGASNDTKPIYLNRALCGADMVLPIGCIRPRESLGYTGISGTLFPTFTDEQTQQRFRSAKITTSREHVRKRRTEADEVAWLLGITFSVQVLPGPGDSILQILAGNVDEVARHGSKCCDQAWTYRLAQKSSLVVATIESEPREQTWENVARALFVAAEAAHDDGAIVLCTNLQCPPGPALQRLASGDDDFAAREIQRSRSSDAMAAALIMQLRERLQLYLVSQLPADTVEDLGLGHVASAEELDRLIRQHDSCVLLPDAHRAVVEITSLDE